MNLRSVFIISFFFMLGIAPVKVCAQQEEQEAKADSTFRKYTKWGIRVDFSRSFFNIDENEAYMMMMEDEMDYLPVFISGSTGPHINVYFNWRIARFLYYQPELTYAIYNYPIDELKLRSMFARITPLQLQFGVHLGWVRPYIFAGAHLDIAINIREMAQQASGGELQFDNFGSRLYWGYSYGGGLDFLSFVQLQYRRTLWMNPFTSFTQSMHLVDEAVCLSFFF